MFLASEQSVKLSRDRHARWRSKIPSENSHDILQLRDRFACLQIVERTFSKMNTLLTLLLWMILLALCWPLAFAALLLWPILWLLSIPFRILAGVVHGLLALITALFLLPARVLGYRG